MPLFDRNSLAGRRVLITGASSGIGRSTAVLLARCGASLILSGRDEERLAQVAAMLESEGHATHAAALDGADEAADLVKALAHEFGSLDAIFHSAGAELIRPMRMTKQAQIDAVFGAAVQGSLGIARAAASKDVMADGGSLLFMSSVAGLRGTAGMAAYSAAKAAVDGLVRSLACELAPRRIRVNTLVSGAVHTEMHGRLGKSLSADGMADYEERHLLGFGRPEDVANAALFLISDASSWVTGTSLVVDGGYMVR